MGSFYFGMPGDNASDKRAMWLLPSGGNAADGTLGLMYLVLKIQGKIEYAKRKSVAAGGTVTCRLLV